MLAASLVAHRRNRLTDRRGALHYPEVVPAKLKKGHAAGHDPADFARALLVTTGIPTLITPLTAFLLSLVLDLSPTQTFYSTIAQVLPVVALTAVVGLG